MPYFRILIIGLMIAVFSLHAIAQKDACVLYFTFSGNAGKTVKDESDNRNDGKIKGGVKWAKGKYGTALEFGGEVGDFVEVADSATLNPAKEISYMAWFMSDKYDNTRGIISKYWGPGGQRTYNLRLHHDLAGALSTEVSSNGQFQPGVSVTDVHSEAVLKDGQWHHAAISFKGGDFLRMYVDGKLANDSKATATKTLFDNETTLKIGQDFNEDAKRFFNGVIDEVAIFNRALNEAEIKTVMKGDFMAVDPTGRLSITWAKLKRQLH
ncbi:MAG: LamG domain-containing protein [Candidatus Poribacteria bacterium]|nr:LamG domain-containing protein [Candidatus Poribacteria bacterium]